MADWAPNQVYTLIEHPHPLGPQPPQPPPVPGMDATSPSSPLEYAAKIDSCLLELPPQSSQGAISSILVTGLSLSNLLPHELHTYSYMGKAHLP